MRSGINAYCVGAEVLQSNISIDDLALYVNQQIKNFFPDKSNFIEWLSLTVPLTLEKVAYCFKHIKVKNYNSTNGLPNFDYLHADQYAIFLVYLAHEAFIQGQINLAKKVYFLNRVISAFDFYYENKPPSIFLLVHPMGSVIGRASLSDFLCIYQGCTIGGNPSDQGLLYPKIQPYVVMYSNSKVIGSSAIGSNVVIGANAIIKNEFIRDFSIVKVNEAKQTPRAVSLIDNFFIRK